MLNYSVGEHLEDPFYVGKFSKEEILLLIDMSMSMVCPKDFLFKLKKKNPTMFQQ